MTAAVEHRLLLLPYPALCGVCNCPGATTGLLLGATARMGKEQCLIKLPKYVVFSSCFHRRHKLHKKHCLRSISLTDTDQSVLASLSIEVNA